MDRFLKTALVLAISMMGFVVNAQRFKTHAVKKGETLSDIANQYGVPVNSILEYNREIKDANSDLERNTILVIPLDAQKNDSKEEVLSGPETGSKKPTQEEPIGFTSHTVQRKETLYGIAKRYHITEEDIKKYNPELYASQLRKKMVLRIPKYHREKSGDTTEQSQMDESLFEEYTVAPKETRWSIAHTYGISIDSMLSLNPTLSKTTDYIQEGQKLKMPKRPGSDLGNQETQLYTSYTVPPKMTFYSLEKKFGIGAEELIKVNPEITERGGLKEGMVIRIPEKRIDPGTVNTDNFIFYEVKPKQTEFSLTRKLGMSYGELVELNPELRDGLKAGMVLKLPKDLSGDFEVRNALVLDKVSLPDSVNRAHRPKMLFMLPFRLNRFNALDEESTEDRLKMPSWTTLSLSMYSGAQMAADSIARLGISVDIKTIDNQYNYAKTKELIRTEDFSDYQAIVGPLDLPSLKVVSIAASKHQVPVIAPVPVSEDIGMDNVFFAYTPEKVTRSRMIDHVLTTMDNQNIIVIADAKNAEAKAELIQAFPEAKVAKVVEERKNVALNLDEFVTLLSKETDNWVFLETGDPNLVSSVSSILNSHRTKEIRIRMFTTNHGNAFENDVISNAHLSNLNFTYPSVYRRSGNDDFVKSYRKRYGMEPDKYATWGFDLVYDLLLKLAYKPNLMEVSSMVGETEYSASKFSYEKEYAGGYYNQASYLMQYDNLRIKPLKE